MSFELNLPTTETTSPLDRLDDRAKRALAGAVQELNPADAIISSHARELPEKFTDLPHDVQQWAHDELMGRQFLTGALPSWQPFRGRFDRPVPSTIEELIAVSPRLPEKLAGLYETKQRILRMGFKTSDGRLVGDSLHMVLMPWREFLSNKGDSYSAFCRWTESVTDEIRPSNWPRFYTDPMEINRWSGYDTHRGEHGIMHNATGYLEEKIGDDGDWGVMLIQSSSSSGIYWDTDRPVLGSPDSLLGAVAGGDKLGYFEWTSLLMQYCGSEDDFWFENGTWLIANRYHPSVSPCDYVPVARVRAGIDIGLADSSNDELEPGIRLAFS